MSHDAATVARFVKTLAICSAAGGVFACFLLACVLSVPREYVDMVTSEMMFYIISMFVPAFTLGAVPAIFYLTSISVDEVHNLGFGMGVITVLYSAGKQVGVCMSFSQRVSPFSLTIHSLSSSMLRYKKHRVPRH